MESNLKENQWSLIIENYKVCKEKINIIDHQYFINHILHQSNWYSN